VPSESELSCWGLTAADFVKEDVEVWQVNWASVSVMVAMQDQWRVGPNGPYALDYCALNEVWERLRIPKKKRDRVFNDLRIMVPEALKTIRKRISST
jgi:hypothetical protein